MKDRSKKPEPYKRTGGATSEEVVYEQRDHNGPVPREEQLLPNDRHLFASSGIEWAEAKDFPPLIAMTVADFACPSFCTSSMTCFGEAPALREYCRVHDDEHIAYAERNNSRWKTDEEIAEAKESGRWLDEETRHMERELDLALQGQQATWADMGVSKMIPDISPKIFTLANTSESAFEFLHYNIWDWTYWFTAESVQCEVVWLSYVPDNYVCRDLPLPYPPDDPSYKNAMRHAKLSSDPLPEPVFLRAIRVHMDAPNRCYSHDEMFDVVQGEEYSSAKSFSTRLFVPDKRFDTENDMMEDIESFDAKSIDYSPIFDAMLGDG